MEPTDGQSDRERKRKFAEHGVHVCMYITSYTT